MDDDAGSQTGVEDAAAWYARRTSGAFGAGAEAGFQRWMAADPAHRAAYARIEATMATLSVLDGRPELAGLRREAAALAQAHRQSQMRMRLAGLGALAAGLALASFIGLQASPVERTVLQAAPGELRQARLSDGTQVWLGPDTRVEVAYTHGRRDVAVVRGEAFFDVAKNKARPFVVAARDRTVTAVGTAFDVRVFASDLVVTLVRGSVAIRRTSQDGTDEARLRPGQQYDLQDGTAVVREVDAQAQVAWRQGLVVLEDTSLAEAVTAFNHNSSVKLLIADNELSALRVSGTFHADRAYDFARALEIELPVTAARQSSGDIILRHQRAIR